MKNEDILASCIDEILDGKATIKECLDKYPRFTEELQALLTIAQSIPPETPAPSAEFKQRSRNRLLEAMQAPQIREKGPGISIFGWLNPLTPTRRLSSPFIAAIVILVLLVTGSTTVFASQNSLPDDTLYLVKTGVERLQLSLTPNPEDKAAFHLRLAQRRIEEVLAQSSLGRDITASAVEAVALQIDAALKEISNLLPDDSKPLLNQMSESALSQQVTLNQILAVAPESTQQALEQALNATQRGDLISRVASGNPDVLTSVPSVLDVDLKDSYFELEGTLLGIEGETWNVGGLLLEGVNHSQGTPPIGRHVEIKGLVRGAQVFIREIEREKETEEWIEIEGIFGGTSPDGRFWYIGGIPFPGPDKVAPPPRGSQLELKGTIEKGIFNISKIDVDEENRNEWKEPYREGVLTSVIPAEKTIIFSLASADLTIHTNDTLIKDNDGRSLSLYDLESLLGENIEVKGLYMKDGFIYATEVNIILEEGRSIDNIEEEEREGEEGDDDDDEDKEADQHHEDEEDKVDTEPVEDEPDSDPSEEDNDEEDEDDEEDN